MDRRGFLAALAGTAAALKTLGEELGVQAGWES